MSPFYRKKVFQISTTFLDDYLFSKFSDFPSMHSRQKVKKSISHASDLVYQEAVSLVLHFTAFPFTFLISHPEIWNIKEERKTICQQWWYGWLFYLRKFKYPESFLLCYFYFVFRSIKKVWEIVLNDYFNLVSNIFQHPKIIYWIGFREFILYIFIIFPT